MVFSDSWEEHLQRLEVVFRHLASANLTVNLSKCDFARATVIYLGRLVGLGTVPPICPKVLAIDQFPAPTTKKELMRFRAWWGSIAVSAKISPPLWLLLLTCLKRLCVREHLT